jgi:hypothetical protein
MSRLKTSPGTMGLRSRKSKRSAGRREPWPGRLLTQACGSSWIGAWALTSFRGPCGRQAGCWRPWTSAIDRRSGVWPVQRIDHRPDDGAMVPGQRSEDRESGIGGSRTVRYGGESGLRPAQGQACLSTGLISPAPTGPRRPQQLAVPSAGTAVMSELPGSKPLYAITTDLADLGGHSSAGRPLVSS